MKAMKKKKPPLKNFFGKPLNNICLMKIISMAKIYLKEKKLKDSKMENVLNKLSPNSQKSENSKLRKFHHF